MSTGVFGDIFPVGDDRPVVTPPEILAAGLVQVVLVVLVTVVVHLRARSAFKGPAGDADTAAALRRLRRRGLVGASVGTTVVTYVSGAARQAQAAGTDDVLATGLPAPAATATGVLVAVAVYALPVVAVALGVRLATVPYRRAVRGFRLRYRDAAAWELERDGVGVVGVLLAAGVVALVPGGWPRIVVAVGLGLVVTVVAPFGLVVALRTRWPTDDEQALVADLLAPGVRLRLVDDRTRLGTALAAGVLPGAEYVFCTESLFVTLDDEEVRAVVAHEVGHHEHEHVLLRYAVVAVAAGAALGVADSAPSATLLAVLLGLVPFAVVLAWVVRRTERQADTYAAETVGGSALASALETLAAQRYVSDLNGLSRLLSYHPPLTERIEGLRESSP